MTYHVGGHINHNAEVTVIDHAELDCVLGKFKAVAKTALEYGPIQLQLEVG